MTCQWQERAPRRQRASALSLLLNGGYLGSEQREEQFIGKVSPLPSSRSPGRAPISGGAARPAGSGLHPLAASHFEPQNEKTKTEPFRLEDLSHLDYVQFSEALRNGLKEIPAPFQKQL